MPASLVPASLVVASPVPASPVVPSRGAGQPSASYADPRLASLYDALNPPGDADAFYLSLPGAAPARILDMGCGTGWLACEFAARGHDVTGADPAAAMLAVARARPGGGRVRWIQAGAAGLATADRFDLIIMTGHAFQLLLEDRDVRAALRALAGHLAPGGRIAFETRNPAVREWQYWNPRDTRQRVEAAGLVADVHYDISGVDGELVTYETWFRFAGRPVTGPVPGPATGRGTGPWWSRTRSGSWTSLRCPRSSRTPA